MLCAGGRQVTQASPRFVSQDLHHQDLHHQVFCITNIVLSAGIKIKFFYLVDDSGNTTNSV